LLQVLQISSVVLAAVVLTLSLSHALELPGKLRLGKDAYFKTQTIYYPGFTIGGAAEPIAVVATLGLLLVIPYPRSAFWLTFTAFVTLTIAHGIYWVLIHPVNKVWLEDQELVAAGRAFFSAVARGNNASEDWTALRDRWEYSHVARAGLAFVGLVALTMAVAC